MTISYDPNRVTYIGETDHRDKRVKFGIKASDRTRHVYVIGKTGTGKSTLLENMAVQDIQNGEGFAFLDPHGKTADLLLDYIPEHRINDVLYFAPFDLAHPVSFNVMEDIGPDKRHLVAAGLMSAFKKIWVDAWSARMEYMLSNTILALLEYPGSTLLGISRMFSDKEFRRTVVSHITDPGVKSFWEDEFAKYTDKFAAEATPAIQNKVGQFTANPVIRNIIGQPKSTFNIREMMDQRKILIINLSKGQVGEDSANLLGSMLITKIYLAAMSRADLREDDLSKLPNFYLYVDEFQSFANESFADILSEARKYKLNLTIAHQYIEQMSEEVRAAVFGNVGTMASFRVGATDAEYLEKEFAPLFTAEDLVNLGFAQVYLKLMIDGMSSAPFSAHTLTPIARPHISYRDVAIGRSQTQFSRPRKVVEEEIIDWHEYRFSAKDSAQKDSDAGIQAEESRERRGENREEGVRERPQGDMRSAPQRDMRGPAQTAARPQQSTDSRAQNRPVSGRDMPPRPPQGQGNIQPRRAEAIRQSEESAQVDREAKLRKAFSLNRLKEEQPKQKKDKGPTEEHLNDLRKALAAVLQKPTEDSEQKEQEERRPQETPQPAQQERPQQSPHSQHSRYQGDTRKRQQEPRQQAVVRQSTGNPVSTAQSIPQQTPKENPPEVPEEVLRKLFEREQ